MKRRLCLILMAGLMLGTASSSFAEETEAEGKQDIVILATSDVHCGIEENFAYAGLEQIREVFEKSGDHTILVDGGDFAQGEAIGTITEGDAIIGLMNELAYDVAIPGNHDYDYGMDQFFKLTESADCCVTNMSLSPRTACSW